MQWWLCFLNVDSNKTQKLCATASPDLRDPQQTAVPMRTTCGRAAAKLDSHGKCMYSIHVHVQVMILYNNYYFRL